MKQLRNLIILSFVAILLNSCSLFYSTKRTFAKGVKQAPYDAVIIPGFPYNGKKWNKVIKMRVMWAKYLYDKGYAKNFIFSGSAVYSPYVESKIFRAYAVEKGIPKENTFVEDRAEHTVENIYYSYNIARDKGFKSVAFATNHAQLNRTRIFIRKHKLQIELLPIVIDTLMVLDGTEPKIEPNVAFKEDFVSIKERENIFQRLAGTFGRGIVWLPKDK